MMIENSIYYSMIDDNERGLRYLFNLIAREFRQIGTTEVIAYLDCYRVA